MISDFRNWIRAAKGLYKYGIDYDIWYEIHIMYRSKATDILTSNASLYIVRERMDDQVNTTFERELIFNGVLSECLEKAEKHKFQSFVDRKINIEEAETMLQNREKSLEKAFEKLYGNEYSWQEIINLANKMEENKI